MPLPDNLLDLPAEETARLIALSMIEPLRTAPERLDHPEDTEALHDFRVGLRRLRTCLRVYRPQLRGSIGRKIRQRLGEISDATRESRDLEVHIAWAREQATGLLADQSAGVHWLLGLMEQKRSLADASLAEVVERRFDPTVERLERQLGRYRTVVRLDHRHLPETGAAVMGRRVRRLTRELRQDLGQVHSVEDAEPAHRARIDAKRLRYVLEAASGRIEGVDAVIAKLKALQDDLGDLHDSHVFVAELDGITEKAPQEVRAGLLVLGERLRRRGVETFARLSADWLNGATRPFFAEVEEVADRLSSAKTPGVEIERKYLLRALPDVVQEIPPLKIRQGYLPGSLLLERIREVQSSNGPTWYRTVKSGAGISRIELEDETSLQVFEAMWPLTEGRRVLKCRYRIPDGDLIWEIDQFTDRDLVLAEVELPSAEVQVEPPAWLAPHVVGEVTDDPAYTNFSLAR
jgi:CHAD domain-containing protein/CYTH domain-containing protein